MEFSPQGGALSLKFAQNRGFSINIPWKLHDFEEIVGARGAQAPRAPLDPLVSTRVIRIRNMAPHNSNTSPKKFVFTMCEDMDENKLHNSNGISQKTDSNWARLYERRLSHTAWASFSVYGWNSTCGSGFAVKRHQAILGFCPTFLPQHHTCRELGRETRLDLFWTWRPCQNYNFSDLYLSMHLCYKVHTKHLKHKGRITLGIFHLFLGKNMLWLIHSTLSQFYEWVRAYFP